MGTWHDRREARALGNPLLLGLVAVLMLCRQQNGMRRQAQILWQLLIHSKCLPTHHGTAHILQVLWGWESIQGKGRKAEKCSWGFSLLELCPAPGQAGGCGAASWPHHTASTLMVGGETEAGG